MPIPRDNLEEYDDGYTKDSFESEWCDTEESLREDEENENKEQA
jgi:hypothetical protein